ncbi:MAG: alpha/beta fold hydrolase [Bacteroidota bacterium]
MNRILHSQILGEGTPLVILHGFLGMGDNWKTLGRKFAELGYQVHLVDQRNHGRSFHDPEFDYKVMAHDLHGYLEHYGLSSVALLGHSMGGKTAMTYATLYPGQLDQLIVADIGPKAYPLHHQDILKALNSLDFSVVRSRGEAESVIASFIKEQGTRLFLLKNLYWREKGQLDLRINLPVLTENIEEIGMELPNESVVTTNSLFVRGANSHYIEDIDFLGIQRQFPQSQLATIPNAGHWLHADNPSNFFDTVVDFLPSR